MKQREWFPEIYNIRRPGPISPLAAQIIAAFLPPKKYLLQSVDFCAIETRIMEHWTMQMAAEGIVPYLRERW